MTPDKSLINFKAEAIAQLRPDCGFVYIDGELSWADVDTPPLSESEINAKAAELEAQYDAKAYARSRAAEYPAIGDQLDALFHAGVFPADMAAAIQAVKDKYPKESA